MTWVLVLFVLHADGAVTRDELPGFRSEAECQSWGRAWAAQATRRSDTDVARVQCVRKKPR